MAGEKGIVVKKSLRELLLERAKERRYETTGISADALELMIKVCEMWISWFSGVVIDAASARSGRERFRITEKDVRTALKQKNLEWILRTH